MKADMIDRHQRPRSLMSAELTKIYRTGDIEVRALNGVDLTLEGGRDGCFAWVRQAAASRRCSTL
jgi:hypothetical protein